MKIARHEVQLPLYYSHFEIAEFSQYYLFDLLDENWAEKELLHLIFTRNGNDAI